ncbi:TPA: hypothetical protein DEW47_02715 [Patescibacteria group bacterium]|nr:MAG: hypothetical protein UT71_C0004G0050 [Parcubacteria group bacterium GW2011_GWF2_40_10]KKR47232.1 MAG: hypothetical protein UT83_C0012G0033 [Parcubacteria group bacterium GW2011_GWA2_40_143]KKR60196.1 MAG: hypothetical protein UT97_C0004G0065 [Parcubacteria group bacterium GW2011_GWC2_40_31]KKR77276.1 MAG: hypothetical protein UU20_C0011G0017 [Parcubacteria group bacterium GW2011_GWE2_40_8]KKR83410.1 MAG: hypothetical protein UU28_C0001G0030 [Parcubacteria group bacterium GW2011_GWD2_40_
MSKNFKWLIALIIIIDIILVFPVMLSYQKIGSMLEIKGIAEVFVTLVVEITLLVMTAIIAYLVSRIYKGTPFQRGFYFIAWGVLFYGIGDSHLLVWMYTGVESFPSILGAAGSSIAHAFGVGLGFILVILGLYKLASARRSLSM